MKISCRSLPHGLDISLAKGSTHLFICLGPAVGHDISPCHAIHIAHLSVWAAFCSRAREPANRKGRANGYASAVNYECRTPRTPRANTQIHIPALREPLLHGYQLADTIYQLPNTRHVSLANSPHQKSCYLPWRTVPHVDAAHTRQINRKISKLRICWHYMLYSIRLCTAHAAEQPIC